jgi:hypothetical protein
MKIILCLALFIFSVPTFASECPSGFQRIAVCSPAAQAGDSGEALGLFDSITLCSANVKNLVVLQKNARSEASEIDHVTTTSTGATYFLISKSVDLVLSIANRAGASTTSAQMTITNKTPVRNSSCHLSCQK